MKKKSLASSSGAAESCLELKDHTGDAGDAPGSESIVKTSSAQQEETTSELKEGAEELSREEDASVAVRKNQALLQEEEDRPHYNPHQGEHSHALYTLIILNLAFFTIAYII